MTAATTVTTTPRQGEFPYVFAYDITDDDRRKAVLKCLKRWRVDGQYSVHETWLRSPQARELSVELCELIDRKKDSLVVCRLDQHKSSPIYQMQVMSKEPPLTGKPRPIPVPKQLPKGNYVICYDIREPKRLQRIQRLTVKQSGYLQRSVYLYQGNGIGLLKLLKTIYAQMEGTDDLRIYNLSHIRDMWFLSQDKPVVPEMIRYQVQTGEKTWWQRLFKWIRG